MPRCVGAFVWRFSVLGAMVMLGAACGVLSAEEQLLTRFFEQHADEVARRAAAARGTGVGGGIAFEDGDGVIVAVQDAGEGTPAGPPPTTAMRRLISMYCIGVIRCIARVRYSP